MHKLSPQNVADLIDQTWPKSRWANTRLLLAVSGGADSVALLRAFLQLSPRRELIDVAHFNHGWRGAESDADEDFVRQLGATHDLRVFIGRTEGTTDEASEKSEQAAREMRYQYLTSTAYQIGARYVVCGHTASDRVETLLHNLFRGTGLAGVRSIEITRPLVEELVLVHPMLQITRNQVLDYLHTLGQDYRQDSSNEDQSYRRNFLRQNLLPLVRSQYGPHLEDKLLSFSEIAADIDSLLQDLAEEYLKNVSSAVRRALAQGQLERLPSSTFVFPRNSTFHVHWAVLRQALYSVWLDRGWPLGGMSRKHWAWIRGAHVACAASSGSRSTWQVRYNLPGDLQLCSCDDWLLIQPARPANDE